MARPVLARPINYLRKCSMFTGIITGVGQIVAIHSLGNTPQHGKRLSIQAPADYLGDVSLGDSIALNGACMTAVAIDLASNQFAIDISAESLNKTSGLTKLGNINLEKALRANDRLGGHIVSGHVDGIGHVSYFAEVGESWELRVVAPLSLAKYLAYKGSVTVNGVSLTVNKVKDLGDHTIDEGDGGSGGVAACEISINIIPHTISNTALGSLKIGGTVNLEIDTVARYVERMMSLESNKK